MQGSETFVITLPDGRKWPAQLRRYKNGRNFRVSLRLGGVAAISMPASAKRRELAEFVAKIGPWLLEKLAEMNFGEISLPERIFSPMHGMSFTVETFPGESPRLILQGECLCLYGDAIERLWVLQAFFKNAARQYLPRILSSFPPEGLSESIAIRVGDQRTRMGACRASKDAKCASTGIITINWRAAFLPLPLLRHLWLHEVAHLSQPNHSEGFYACLECLSPQARQREKELNAAWRSLPDWLLYHF